MFRHFPVLPFLFGTLLAAEATFLALVQLIFDPGPSHPWSVALGAGGLGSMIAMLIYSVARRWALLRRVMRLSSWLHLHIFLGTQGVLMVAFHCVHLLDGAFYLLNPGVLNLAAVLVVFGSGVFGRFLYARLPKGEGGAPTLAQRVFAVWLVLHRPIAAGMYVISFVHVALALIFSPLFGVF